MKSIRRDLWRIGSVAILILVFTGWSGVYNFVKGLALTLFTLLKLGWGMASGDTPIYILWVALILVEVAGVSISLATKKRAFWIVATIIDLAGMLSLLMTGGAE